MKLKALLINVLLILFGIHGMAQDLTLEEYLLNYDYESRKEMKINSEQLVKLIKSGKVQLIDIRFL